MYCLLCMQTFKVKNYLLLGKCKPSLSFWSSWLTSNMQIILSPFSLFYTLIKKKWYSIYKVYYDRILIKGVNCQTKVAVLRSTTLRSVGRVSVDSRTHSWWHMNRCADHSMTCIVKYQTSLQDKICDSSASMWCAFIVFKKKKTLLLQWGKNIPIWCISTKKKSEEINDSNFLCKMFFFSPKPLAHEAYSAAENAPKKINL